MSSVIGPARRPASTATTTGFSLARVSSAPTSASCPSSEPRADHASYLASWLEVLSNDKRFILSAAAHAQRAVTYLHDLQPKPAEIDQAA